MLTGSALALAFGLPGVAHAQLNPTPDPQSDPATTEDVPSSSEDGNVSDGNAIVITGIRARIESSQAIKREADTFVDAVTAEDIGALPDRSVTETLQRIPGVTINRFQGQNDPDHFSVEGSNVVIRGLTYVRSEFNGRDAFSVNTGRALGFSDVSPELLASVVVFKNVTADRIEGGIAGLVDLRTRKAFDNRKLIVAGTLEGQYGDIRKKLGYNGSLLLADTFSTPIGSIGALVSYGRSKLYSTAFGTQVTDFTYRPEYSTGNQLNFVPRGGGTKSQDFDRGRQTFDASLQFESLDERAKITLEYIRATSQQLWGENVIETDIGNTNQPTGTDFAFDGNGLLTSGLLAGAGPNLQSFISREQDTKTRTQDYSINAELHPTDRLTLVVDGQYARANSDQIDMSIYGAVTPLFVNLTQNRGTIPDVVQVNGDGSPATQLNDINSYYYRAAMDHVEENKGREYAFRADAKYDIDSDFLRAIHVGGRYSDREQTRKYTTYNWANISEVWNGGITPFTDAGPLGATQFDFPNFQRDKVAKPGPGYFLSNIVQNYRTGSLQDALLAARTGGNWVPLAQRPGVIPGTPYLPGDINNSAEQTYAAYGRLDFGVRNIGGAELSGNIGLRYSKTSFQTRGFVTTPNLALILGGQNGIDPRPGFTGQVTQANAVAVAQFRCATVAAGQAAPGYCLLSPDRLQQLVTFSDNTFSPVALRNSYDDFLPSFNVNLRFDGGLVLRAAASRGLTRPDFGTTAFSASLFPTDFTAIQTGGGDPNAAPLFTTFTGGARLTGVRSWNYDVGVEYYFRPSASVTLNAFYKDLKDILASGSNVQTFQNGAGATALTQVNQQVNIGKGNVKGVEVAYQQFYDFLPGALSGLGFEGNYTFIDPSTFPNQVTELRFVGLPLPLQSLSKHQFNVSALYEKYGISARASYSWRSRFLLAPRDEINPFAPIYNTAGGQLDASIFYALTPNIKLGVQGNNLLDQVTQTEAQTSANLGGGNQVGPLAPRSYFRNDRRFNFGVRFNF